MKHLIFRILNPPIVVMFAMLGLSIETAVFQLPWIRYFQPDLTLLLVLWMAFRREFTEGGIITLILAQISEAQSGVPKGLFLASYLFIYLAVRYARHVFHVPNLRSYLVVTFWSSIVFRIVLIFLFHLLVQPTESKWLHTLYLLLPGALIQVVIAIPLYRWLDRFDTLTYKQVILDEVHRGLNEQEGF